MRHITWAQLCQFFWNQLLSQRSRFLIACLTLPMINNHAFADFDTLHSA